MRKGLVFISLVGLVSLLLIIVLPVGAAGTTVFSNTTPGAVDAAAITRTVLVSGQSAITDLKIAVTFNNVDNNGGCHLNPTYSLSNELSMQIQSPVGTAVNLVNSNTFTPTMPGVPNPTTITFDDSAGPLPSVPVTGTFSPVSPLSAFDGQNPNGLWTLTFQDNVGGDLSCFYQLDIIFSGSAPDMLDVFEPGDDRINHHAIDRAAPVAIYCQSYGIQIYDVDGYTGKGSILPIISLSHAEVEAMGVPTDAPLLLAESGDTTLWRLPTGEFQVNAYYDVEWKPWAFLWDACPMTTGRHLNN